MIENIEFLNDFIEEAKVHMQVLELDLVKISEKEKDPELINELFRAVHSIKGTASFFNLVRIVELAHRMENIMVKIRADSLKVNDDIIDILLESNDFLKVLVEDALNNENYNINYLIEKFMDVEKIANSGEVNCVNQAECKKEEAPVIKEPSDKPQNDEPYLEKEIKNIKSFVTDDSIRVNVTLLNSLLNLASELVLGRNQLLRAMEKYHKDIAGMDPILQNIDHITTELQEKIMQTRMQSIANVFNKFPRIIRDMAKKLGKEIELIIEGGDVEMDKSIIEALGDPLTHLIRNAVDHGVEKPDERIKDGKMRMGKVIMKAYHESGYVNVDIIDDGKGIDLEKIKKKVIENGIVDRNELMTMKDHEVAQLIFKPGFSTADEVTDYSGRGVGMDVVKTNIEKLGGAIEIFTCLHKGTTFRLLLPLTLAIISAIIVEVENQKFALPQVNLQEIVRIKAGDVNRKIEYVNKSEVLRLRGGLLPIVHLADVLGIKRTYIDSTSKKEMLERRKTILGSSEKDLNQLGTNGKNDFGRKITDTIRILVIKIGSKKIGLIANKIHGSEEILVKPLPVFIKDCRCYSGVTIMGDGKTAMILDPEGIITKANFNFTENTTQKVYEKNTKFNLEGLMEQQSILIFKCSGIETFAIDLSMVSRVEQIVPSDIKRIGEMDYIRYRGDMLRIIRPEDYLPLNKGTEIPSKYYVIIPKIAKNPIGILIEKIYDTTHTVVKLNNEDLKIKGILGSSIIGDKIVLFLNIYELFEIVNPDRFCIQKSLDNQKYTVLIVEDTPFFRKIEKDYLEDAGFNVMVAENGREALEILDNSHIDIVVSDIKMPIMDGIELIKKIRMDEKLAQMPVIALTSMTDDASIKEGVEAGFDVYEHKLDRTSLVNVVNKAIDCRRSKV